MARKAVTLSFSIYILRSFKLLVTATGVQLILSLLILCSVAKPTTLAAGLSQLKSLFEFSPMRYALLVHLWCRCLLQHWPEQ
jgi:hypothetical protein